MAGPALPYRIKLENVPKWWRDRIIPQSDSQYYTLDELCEITYRQKYSISESDAGANLYKTQGQNLPSFVNGLKLSRRVNIEQIKRRVNNQYNTEFLALIGTAPDIYRCDYDYGINYPTVSFTCKQQNVPDPSYSWANWRLDSIWGQYWIRLGYKPEYVGYNNFTNGLLFQAVNEVDSEFFKNNGNLEFYIWQANAPVDGKWGIYVNMQPPTNENVNYYDWDNPVTYFRYNEDSAGTPKAYLYFLIVAAGGGGQSGSLGANGSGGGGGATGLFKVDLRDTSRDGIRIKVTLGGRGYNSGHSANSSKIARVNANGDVLEELVIHGGGGGKSNSDPYNSGSGGTVERTHYPPDNLARMIEEWSIDGADGGGTLYSRSYPEGVYFSERKGSVGKGGPSAVADGGGWGVNRGSFGAKGGGNVNTPGGGGGGGMGPSQLGGGGGMGGFAWFGIFY